jgi:hypothetical protein
VSGGGGGGGGEDTYLEGALQTQEAALLHLITE